MEPHRNIPVWPSAGVEGHGSAEAREGNPGEPEDWGLSDGRPRLREITHPLPPISHGHYESLTTHDPELVDAARKMTAHYYLQRHFVTPDQLDAGGRITEAHDPYLSQAEYYVIRNTDTDAIAATCRKIHYNADKDEAAFPLFEHLDQLYPDKVAKLRDIGFRNVAELSSLVKNPQEDVDGQAVLTLYRQLFQNAWRADNEGREAAYIMACNPKLYKRLRFLFGDLVEQLGPALEYPGQEVVPAMIVTRSGTAAWIRESRHWSNPHAYVYRKGVRALFTGVDAEQLDPILSEALVASGYADILQPASEKREVAGVSRRPEAIAAAVLLGYTAARTLAVKEAIAPGTTVDWRIFLGIEVATTWPYAKGMGTLLRSAARPQQFTARQKWRAGSVAGSSFMAPYAYLVAEGSNMPTEGWVGTGVLAAVGLTALVMKLRNARREHQSESVATESSEDAA